VNASSAEYNLVIFSVDLGAGEDGGAADVSYLRLADSDLAVEGSTVYALGNPLALVHTITDGIVANVYREVDGNIFFQFTAPISFGSGGSPVLNTLGQVVGVASSSFSYGQNMNLAVPANLIKELAISKCVSLNEFIKP
jgi:S1-C subfamily serine protease